MLMKKYQTLTSPFVCQGRQTTARECVTSSGLVTRYMLENFGNFGIAAWPNRRKRQNQFGGRKSNRETTHTSNPDREREKIHPVQTLKNPKVITTTKRTYMNIFQNSPYYAEKDQKLQCVLYPVCSIMLVKVSVRFYCSNFVNSAIFQVLGNA